MQRKQIRLQKIIFSILALLFNVMLSAEYIFFKSSESGKPVPIEKIEHDTLYPLLLKYTFPTNSNPLYDYSELDQKDFELMYTDELAFLQKQLADTDIQAVFIPNTLYELFTLYCWLQFKLLVPDTFHDVQIYKSIFGFPRVPALGKKIPDFLTTGKFENPVKEIYTKMALLWEGDIDEQASYLETFDYYHQLNTLDQIEYIHYLMNTQLINYFNSNFYSLKKIDSMIISCILNHLISVFSLCYDNYHFGFTGVEVEYYLCGEGIIEKELLQHVIDEELYAYQQGNCLIYRGARLEDMHGRSNKIDSSLTYRDNGVHANSVSYGLTLFAGLFGNDALYFGGAMAYSFFVRGELAYALQINKLDYMQNKNLKELFYIAPVGTLLGLVSQSELFHARTKGALDNERDVLCGILMLNGVNLKVPTYLKVIKDKIVHEHEFCSYLVDNAIIFKNETGLDTNYLLQNQLRSISFTDYSDTNSGFSDLSWQATFAEPFDLDILMH